MVLAGGPFHKFTASGLAKPFGRGLVGFELELGHNAERVYTNLKITSTRPREFLGRQD